MWHKEVPLCAEPSAIAPVAALLSMSRFPADIGLHPSDDLEEIKRKLDGLRFKLLPHGRGVDTATHAREQA